MKTIVTLVALCIVWTGLTQTKYTYYLTGRPDNVERNNAILTIGKSWDILFEYAGSDIVEMQGLEKIQKHNDSVSQLIAKETKLGEEWQTYFFSSVDKEQTAQQLIREEIKVIDSYIAKSSELFEPFLLMTRKKKCLSKLNFKYTVYLVGQLKTDEQRKFITVGKYRYNTSKKKIRELSVSSSELPFFLPQNGIN